jgi:NAD+ diphosphatase
VNAVLAHRDGSTIRPREYKKFDDDGERSSPPNTNEKAEGVNANASLSATGDAPPPPPAFRVPPASAIAGVLIRDWAAGRIGFGAPGGAGVGAGEGGRKGNL